MSHNQSNRLTKQHKGSQGCVGIFGEEAQEHDHLVGRLPNRVLAALRAKYPNLEFRIRESVSKEEINEALGAIDKRLGKTLYVESSCIKPDGGLLEVKDDNGKWRIILVAEAKHQGKDIENIKKGILVGVRKDQDIMVAGNAIERAHKNIFEIANLMLSENHFPYILFLEGSNFLTQTVRVRRPDGRVVVLEYNAGNLNRLDRLTAANYGLPMNTNLCENIFLPHEDKMVMLQATSIYTQGNGSSWSDDDMFKIMLEVSETSLKVLARDIFKQITK